MLSAKRCRCYINNLHARLGQSVNVERVEALQNKYYIYIDHHTEQAIKDKAE